MTNDDTRQHLTELPDLYRLLPAAAHTRATVEGPRPAPASKPPTRLDVVDLLDTRHKPATRHHHEAVFPDPDRVGVLPLLQRWTRHYTQQTPPTVVACCATLTEMLPAIQHHPDYPEMVAAIKDRWHAVRAATADVRDVQHQVPCRNCGGELEQQNPKLWRCKACGHEVSVIAATLPQARRALLLEHGDKAPTLRTLQNWANRPGLLPGLLESGPRSNVYDMATIRSVTASYLLKNGTLS